MYKKGGGANVEIGFKRGGGKCRNRFQKGGGTDGPMHAALMWCKMRINE